MLEPSLALKVRCHFLVPQSSMHFVLSEKMSYSKKENASLVKEAKTGNFVSLSYIVFMMTMA